METILDETSLIPCDAPLIPERIHTLARVIKCLDDLGTMRVLRSVRDALDRDIGEGRGLRSWCFDPRVDRDAGRLIATRLGKQPYIDGDAGMLQDLQRRFVVECKLGTEVVLGLAVVALQGGVATALLCPSRMAGGMVPVQMTYLDDEGERSENIEVPVIIRAGELNELGSQLRERILGELQDGRHLLESAGAVFSRLRFGARAAAQIGALTGHEIVFRQLVWHLHVLHRTAVGWVDGPFEPDGIAWSTDSTATLNKFGYQREFPVPDGFADEQWRLHTKLTGGNGARLYYRFETVDAQAVVLIGYFGDHLSTIRYP